MDARCLTVRDNWEKACDFRDFNVPANIAGKLLKALHSLYASLYVHATLKIFNEL